MSHRTIPREGFLALLDNLKEHIVQLLEDGIRTVDADKEWIQSFGKMPTSALAAKAEGGASLSPMPGNGLRWARAIRRGKTDRPMVWAICAEGVSFQDKAGTLLGSILDAADFDLEVLDMSAQDPKASLVLAFGTQAFQHLTGQPRTGFERSRGQVLDTPNGPVLATYASPDLLPNNIPLKRKVWGDIKQALACFSLEPKRVS